MNGTEKRIDSLGRVVLPANIRKKLGLKPNSKLMICLEENVILMTPSAVCCALCGNRIDADSKPRLCGECIDKVKKSN